LAAPVVKYGYDKSVFYIAGTDILISEQE
jgi:hypothetical protein